ncbi:hypothetical protein [Caryophanon latum]|uniref:Uncharacterized protein n=1 Tax=Caryophanon latum TaxID=33977 RepID=A0A1C0Z2C4_9BACL|nr:hypothetical protein [Caryophanon latum]OCS93518.1 hypothetical protein A6K76_05095 [Caryophanon latum]
MNTLYPYEQLPHELTKHAVWQYVQSIRHCRDRQHPIYQFFIDYVTETITIDMQRYGLQYVDVLKTSSFEPVKLTLKDVSPIWSTRLVKLFEDAHVPFLAMLQEVAPQAYRYEIQGGQFRMTEQESLSLEGKQTVLMHTMPLVAQQLTQSAMTPAQRTWLLHMYTLQLQTSIDVVNAYLTLQLAQAVEEVEHAQASEQSIFWPRLESRFKGDTLLFTEEGQYICTFLQYMKDATLQQQFMLYDKDSMLDAYAYIQ